MYSALSMGGNRDVIVEARRRYAASSSIEKKWRGRNFDRKPGTSAGRSSAWLAQSGIEFCPAVRRIVAHRGIHAGFAVSIHA